ncbi:hypothetical protein J4E85_009692 [Alternaria conjuncta]|uniref:uncharacterized protein n=1 Tax=Alternaria conjuncta TaxID=181017 RepID=UPI00221E7B22|nr:uncharacterized protein J4E85_009692 [Alternaria conjuncta]KAI4918902.1 hypothetical protein J4E85_009692 [Alternaria conjuncta]
METAGLAVGTLALIGVFEDCVTLLSQIGAAKCMEKDYTLLKTRLNFQKTLLLQWAERLKLHDVDGKVLAAFSGFCKTETYWNNVMV